MISVSDRGVYIDLLVQPKARRPGLIGLHGDRLKLAVTDPPERGKANNATVVAVAELLEVPTRAVTLVSGHTSRRKRVHVERIDPTTARHAIDAALRDL